MASYYGKRGNLTSLLVASSTASAADKEMCDYLCTGVADDVTINAALTALNGSGKLFLSAGVFTCANTLNVTGTTAGSADNPNLSIIGVGSETTILNMATNINGITITAGAKVVFRDFQIKVLGTGTGIKSTGQTISPYWSLWDSEFTNIMIRGDFSTHTGYAIDLESPFRSTFTNIEAKGIKNGIRIKSHNVNFNPGNCTFIRCFMDCGITGGVAWTVQSVLGYMNICIFIMCESIDSSATPAGSTGWLFTGVSAWASRNHLVLQSNTENFNTVCSLVYATDNDIQLDYANSAAGGTIFLLDANSVNNNLRVRQNYVPPSTTSTLINDSSTSVTQPNILSGLNTYVAGTLAISNSTTTVFRECFAPGSGTVPWQVAQFNLPSNILKSPITTYTPAAAGTATIDLSKGNVHHVTMPAGNITLAVANATVGQCFILRLLQDGTGSRLATQFTTIKWAGGTAPTLTTAASKADTFGYEVTGAGTYDGYVIGQNI
jgi:hypothetical protein